MPKKFWIVTKSNGDGSVGLHFFTSEEKANRYEECEQACPYGEPFCEAVVQIDEDRIDWDPEHSYEPEMP